MTLFPLLTLALVMAGLLQPFCANAAPLNTIPQAGAKQHVSPFAPLAHKQNSSNLVYHGGPVMGGSTNVYVIFWEPKGSYVSPNYNRLIIRYFNDVGGSWLYHNNTQYHDSHNNYPNKTILAGSWIDTTPYRSITLSPADTQQEVLHAQNVKRWKSSMHTIFFVFTARGKSIACSQDACSHDLHPHLFCANHSFFGTDTIYAAIPYAANGCHVPSSPNHDMDADSAINVSSHEQMEAATDPLGNAWYDSSYLEMGDKCAWIFGPLNNYGGNVVWNAHPYIVQKEWDNAKSSCRIAGP